MKSLIALFSAKKVETSIANLSADFLTTNDLMKIRGGGEPAGREEMNIFLNNVESVARKSKVRIFDIKPGDVKTQGFYKKYSVELEFDAEMEKIIAFIYTIEKKTGFEKAEKLRLVKPQNSSSNIKAYAKIVKVILFR